MSLDIEFRWDKDLSNNLKKIQPLGMLIQHVTSICLPYAFLLSLDVYILLEC
jgi:hypothetical protein